MRKPTHPGEILHHEYLVPLGLTQGQFAAHIGVEIKAINRLIRGHTSVSPAMALRLGAALDTSPEFWLNLQSARDVWETRQALDDLPSPLHRTR